MIATLFISFAILIILGVPIAITLGISSTIALVFFSSYDLTVLPQRIFASINSFTLMAIPFFMLAGSLMRGGGISKRLIMFADALVGWISGGLAMAAIVASMMFASISGSATATVAAIGGILVPEMKQRGYPAPFATAIVAAAGTMGPVIPPSIGLIVYATLANVSVMDLFLGGYIPGIMMGVALMIISFITAKKHNFPCAKRITLKELVRCFIDALWALITPIIIVGGIISGIFTPTEAGAVSCAYAFIVGWFIYKELTPINIVSVLKDSAQTTGIVLLLVGTASIFSWILTTQRVPQTLAFALTSLSNNKIIILLLVNIITLIVGMFIDSTPSMLMLCPVFFPLMDAIGIDLVHFGVFFEINLCIGLLTPPVGSCMFVACRIGEVSIVDILKPLYINIAVLIIVLLTVVYIPQLVLFLPGLVK